jgi:hypothetical protein
MMPHYGKQTFTKYTSKALAGYNNRHLSGVTADQCKQRCLDETAFSCKSFDYFKSQNKCDLSVETKDTITWVTDVNYDHYVIDSPVHDGSSVEQVQTTCSTKKDDKSCQAHTRNSDKAQFCTYNFASGSSSTGVCEGIWHQKAKNHANLRNCYGKTNPSACQSYIVDGEPMCFWNHGLIMISQKQFCSNYATLKIKDVPNVTID